MDEDQIKLIKNFVDGKNIFLARPGKFIVYIFDVLNEQTVGFSWNYSLAWNYDLNSHLHLRQTYGESANGLW